MNANTKHTSCWVVWINSPLLNFLLQNEGMTGVVLYNIRFSRVTFGLLEDTGLVLFAYCVSLVEVVIVVVSTPSVYNINSHL